MPTRGSISKRGKGPIRAEAGPDVNANHAPIQISRGAGVTLVVASLKGFSFVGCKGPTIPFSNYETTRAALSHSAQERRTGCSL